MNPCLIFFAPRCRQKETTTLLSDRGEGYKHFMWQPDAFIER